MVGFPPHLAKRLPRLSGWAPWGTCVAIWGNGVLWLPPMPRMRAAQVVTGRAIFPLGTAGYPCSKARCRARYLRRLSLIVCSFWIGRAFQREYTMGQPLNYLSPNNLSKCPVERRWIPDNDIKPSPAHNPVKFHKPVERLMAFSPLRVYRCLAWINTVHTC
jgi:hypothetical protein